MWRKHLARGRRGCNALAFAAPFSEHPPPMSTRDAQGGRRRYAVIMAGGSGTRFWPQSRRRLPKQFLSIDGGRTLLQATAARLRGFVSPAHIVVVAPGELAPLVRRQLPTLPRQNVVIEPAARGTAGCLALAAAWISQRDPAAAMAVFPADHTIGNEAQFRRCVARAFETAETEDCLVTFGIPPTRPETGYGYIEVGEPLQRGVPRVHWVARFIEKPDRATAQRLIGSGRHLWNSGMFVWRVTILHEALQRHAPEVGRVLELFSDRRRAATPAAQRVYRRLPGESIDVALMERATRVAVISATFAWDDVGSWAAMRALWGVDPDGNASRGEALLIDCRDTVVYGATRLVAVVGANDLVVVDSPDAVLVCPRDRAQEVRRVVDALARGRHRRLL
jgi:mannose-1-phosphate guanylyltransferase